MDRCTVHEQRWDTGSLEPVMVYMKKMLTEDQAQAIAKRLQAWKDRNKENKWIQEVADKKIRELSKRLTNQGSVLVY